MENHSSCEPGRRKMWESFWDNPDFHKKVEKMVRSFYPVKSQGTRMWKNPSRDGPIESAKEECEPWETAA